MHDFIIFTIGGLAAAGIYAITASGLTLTYTTTGIFNWAHGAIGMVCAFVYWQMSIGWGWPTLVSMLVCLFVVAPAIGIAIEAAVMRRLEGVSEASKLVVTLAIALMLLGLAQWIWDPTTYRALPPLFNNDTLVLGSIRISYNDVTVLILALVVAIGLRLFLYRTRMGVTMRASVDDRTLTSLNGSSAVANARNAWIIGSMLAALAGILIAPTLTLSASALTLLIVNAYAASVIGRLRSIPMTFVGAIILGLSIAYSVAYLPQNPYIQGFENAVPAIILFIALLVLPQSRLRGHRQLRSRELAFRPTWNGTGLFCAGTIIAAVFLATTVSTADLFSLNRMWGLAIVGLSVIPIVGYAGRLSLCQMTFAGIGATMVGHLGAQGNPLSLLAAAGVCAVVGVIVAIPALRLSGIYFALATAAFAITMDNWVFVLPSFNLFGHPYAPFGSGSLVFAPFRIGSLALNSKTSQFIAGSVAFVILVVLVVALRRSEFGQRLLAMKDSPAACATLGMNGRAIAHRSVRLLGRPGGSRRRHLRHGPRQRGARRLPVLQRALGTLGDGCLWDHFVRCGGVERPLPGIAALHQPLPFPHPVAAGPRRPRRYRSWGPRPMGPSRAASARSISRWRDAAGCVALIVAVVGAAWALRLSGAIGNWTMTIIMVVDLALFPVPVYVADYRARIAPPAFGLPERRSKEKRDAWFAEAVSDEGPVGSADPLASLSGAGGTSGA